MEQIGLVGTCHRLTALETLDAVARQAAKWREDLSAFREALQVPEVVLLATCNRVEVAFVLSDDDTVQAVRRRVFRLLKGREPEPGEAETGFRAWAGEGAVEHLALVAAGFDSARVGEAEIRLQVREALDAAHEVGVSGSQLDATFELVLRLAKQVQRETQSLSGPASIADIAVQRVRAHLLEHPGPVALVGVSPMTQVCFSRLMNNDVECVVANRTLARAEEMIAGTAARAMPLQSFLDFPPDVTAVIVALASQAAPFTAPQVEALANVTQGPLLMVDFGVPATVPSRLCRAPRVTRFGMDDMIGAAESERDSRLLALAPARAIIEEGLEHYRDSFAVRSAGAAIAALETHYQDLAADHTRRFLRRQCGDLTPAQQNLIEQHAGNLARKFAHVPARGVRALASDFGLPAVRGFLAAADKGLERSLASGAETRD